MHFTHLDGEGLHPLTKVTMELYVHIHEPSRWVNHCATPLANAGGSRIGVSAVEGLIVCQSFPASSAGINLEMRNDRATAVTVHRNQRGPGEIVRHPVSWKLPSEYTVTWNDGVWVACGPEP